MARDIKGFVPRRVGPKPGKGFMPLQMNVPPMPMVPPKPMMPKGPKFIPPRQQFLGPGFKKNVAIKPIGNLLLPRHQVMSHMEKIAAKRMGVRKVGQKPFGQQENAFRARKQNIYSNVTYNQQGKNLSSKYNSQGIFNYGNNYSKLNNKTYSTKTYGTGENYQFHEIVETSDNSKSYVVAKKDGVTVSSDQ